MEVGTSQKVVKYSLDQKLGELRAGRYLYIHKLNLFEIIGIVKNYINQKSKSACQLRTKDAYIVLSRSVPLKIASRE